jgi:hypothetical protein
MGKIVAAVVVVVLAFLGYTWLFDTDVEGEFDTPEVEVETRGEFEAPEVDVRGPEVETGEKEVEFTVPTISVEGADDDFDGEEDEVIEGDAKTDEFIGDEEYEEVDGDEPRR